VYILNVPAAWLSESVRSSCIAFRFRNNDDDDDNNNNNDEDDDDDIYIYINKYGRHIMLRSHTPIYTRSAEFIGITRNTVVHS
jgi:hypothetical protein